MDAEPEQLSFEAALARLEEIVRLLGEGLSNDEIGARLVIETSTVKSHLTRVMTKLDTRDRLQTVVWAWRSGLLG